VLRGAHRLVLVAALSAHAGSCPGRVAPPDRSVQREAAASSAQPAPKSSGRANTNELPDPGDRGREPAPTMSYLGADWLTRPERIEEEQPDPERIEEEQPDKMLDALGIRPGQSVADIGAGVGYHAIRIAGRVGPEGRVFATDIQEEMLSILRKNLRERSITNVIPILSGDESTGLPPRSIDLVLMVDVYHELSHPERFLEALKASLRPGARVALVEFRGEDPSVPIREEHKMTAEQVIRELSGSGFRLVERLEFLPWQHILIFAERVEP
jgi:protein-L-isoaspartate O-methyltransferase